MLHFIHELQMYVKVIHECCTQLIYILAWREGREGEGRGILLDTVIHATHSHTQKQHTTCTHKKQT